MPIKLNGSSSGYTQIEAAAAAGDNTLTLPTTSGTLMTTGGSNTFTANQIISVTDNTNAALRITQLGTGNALVVEDSTNPDSSPFVITADGDLLQGSATLATSLGYAQGAQFFRQAGTIGQLRYSDNTGSPELVSSKARGTQASSTSVASGDALWLGRFAGHDGTGFVEAARISVQVDGTPGTNDMPGRLVFSTTADGASTPTERMRINSSGSVSIGSSDAAFGYLLNINAPSAGIYYKPAGNNSNAMDFRNAANTQVGSIYVTSTATTFSTSSDYRLKEDVQTVLNAASRLMSLNPVNFAWKADGSRVDGFIAHEVQAIIPEAVTGQKDAVDADGNPVYQGIDQSKLVPLLTAALQEALTKIDALEARIAALEAI